MSQVGLGTKSTEPNIFKYCVLIAIIATGIEKNPITTHVISALCLPTADLGNMWQYVARGPNGALDRLLGN